MKPKTLSIAPPFQPTGAIDAARNPIFADARGALFVLPRERLTLPSLVTLCGYALTLAWVAGAPWWLGALGIAADEIDGRMARARGEVTKLGGELDYAVDVTLTGLCALRAFGPAGLAVLPLVTARQAQMRANGQRPRFGSARAAFGIAGMVR